MAPKIHELLAVETSLANTADAVLKETTKVFINKPTLFLGSTKSHQIFDDLQQHLVQAPEVKEVEDTVPNQLDFLAKHIAPYWDVLLQKEAANQHAKADIIINGEVLAKDVPAIVLLSLEKKLTALMPLYTAVPTLNAAESWNIDPTYSKPNVYCTRHAEERQQTQNVEEYIIVAQATDKHPAQVAKQTKTNIIGKYIVNSFSGAIPSIEKANKLGRLTALIRAVKTARQRANEQEVNTSLKIGDALLSYING